MDSDAKPDGPSIKVTKRHHVGGSRLDHPRCIASSLGMILLRVWPSENGYTAVTRVADDKPSGSRDAVTEMLEDPVE
jgi:hypothetical protein